MSKTIALKPRMSEKTYALSQAENTFVFDVPTSVNKFQVANAVSDQFEVTVEDVRITVIKGKQARSIRLSGKSRRQVMGRRSDFKKAYVRLKDGDSIPIFASIEEEEKKEAEAAEKAAKKAKKEKK